MSHLTTADWLSPRLCLRVTSRPKSKERVEAACSKCGDVCRVVFSELVRKVNNQAKFVEFYHCPSCYRGLESFRQASRERSLKVRDKIVATCSEKSKALWLDPEYKNKCLKASEDKSQSAEFSNKVSKALKKKFAEDEDYVRRVKLARAKYYTDKNNPNSLTQEEFIKKSIQIHGDRYGYSNVRYKSSRLKVEIICKDHGSFLVRPSHHVFFGNGCPQCNIEKTRSKGETDLSEWISTVYGGQIVHSNRTILNGLEIDIWIPEHKLGIEYHGAYYHSYDKKESSYQRNYHSLKSTLAHKANINLLQFVDLDIVKRPDVAKSMIFNKLGLNNRIFARNCALDVVSIKESVKFFNDNHFHGGIPSSVVYGLFFADELISAVGFTLRDGIAEISRFATKRSTTVVGGFSRILKTFRENHSVDKIFTYVDRSFTTSGNCYEKAGMNFIGITKPGYRYFKNNRLYNRRSFQKHKLPDLLNIYDPSKTEAENMFNNGYRRLWDAGNLKYAICQ